ncbi:alpha/beta hydrolase [Corynebacterium diphtheriae]|uniref:alpha/beta hydrolase n=1 Tax=Corynebacterium diphtheriae TaxID=1717 RepID=UPI003989C72C
MLALDSRSLALARTALAHNAAEGHTAYDAARYLWNRSFEELKGQAFDASHQLLSTQGHSWSQLFQAIEDVSRILELTYGPQKDLEAAYDYLLLLSQRSIDNSAVISTMIAAIRAMGNQLDQHCAQAIDSIAALCKPDYPQHQQLAEDFEQRLAQDFPDAQILSVHEHGVVVALGDIRTADSITTVVAGVGSANPTQWLNYVERAQHIRHATGGAAVAWLGYNAPANVAAAAAQTPAQQGASQLQKFQKELRALNPKARLMVFGHSYGSVVAGHAAAHGLDADTFIVAGSPGVPPNPQLHSPNPRLISVLGSHDIIGLTGTNTVAAHGIDPSALSAQDAGFERWGVAGGHESYFTDKRLLQRLAQEAHRGPSETSSG